jgi:predicted dehydrogenase/threonine dehydrogenase-like Zn-dependent dehydrogenase
MKQVLQDLAKGDSYLIEAPAPKAKKNHLLIATRTTLISAGTEKMLVNFGKANFIDKARQQPDKVKMVLEKVHTDGLMTTVDAVKSKLGQPLPLGYCNVGIVSEVGDGALGYQKDDRVVSNGPHADIVRVSKNLCAKIPVNVSDEEAAFTVVGSIGLQGIRLAKPTLGECFVVTGVGLIGLIVVQLLRANGCRVLAIDYDDEKLKLAQSFGAEICNPGKGEDPIAVGMAFSRGNGVDGVIITASTKSNDPVSNAARMSRKRGRIILVGVVGLDLIRAEFYEKELTFQVSCSYGPGRYDVEYEEKGNDYPFGFVRWTQQRNFEAILDMMASGQLNVKTLVTHRFEFDEAEKAYELLTNDNSAFGILLNYSSTDGSRLETTVKLQSVVNYDSSLPVVGFVGAGNYASRILIPAFKKSGVRLHTISTSGGINGVIHGEKSGFENATTETDEMINNPEVNTVVIVTQHNSHAHFVVKALTAGKNVFVEKPLALTIAELDSVKTAFDNSYTEGFKPKLMVGFNRRFSPQIKKMKALLNTVNEPKSFIMTMNAGDIPSDHWIQDNELGGGRIIGEACHYIDLMRHLAGSKIISVQARRMSDAPSVEVTEDRASITLGFEDGSFGTIHYFANGAASFPKERIEVFAGGKVIQLDNFIKMKGFGWKGFKKLNLWKQDKGQTVCTNEFTKSIALGIEAPISSEEIFEIAKVSIEVAEMLRNQKD